MVTEREQRALDFGRQLRKAQKMTIDALKWSIGDCYAACKMAEEMERKGIRTLKSGGYYRDEGSVYRLELRNRLAKQV